MPHELGQPVRQVVPVITGTVADVTYIAAESSFRYLVDFTDAAGHPAQRWFKESEIEAAEVTP